MKCTDWLEVQYLNSIHEIFWSVQNDIHANRQVKQNQWSESFSLLRIYNWFTFVSYWKKIVATWEGKTLFKNLAYIDWYDSYFLALLHKKHCSTFVQSADNTSNKIFQTQAIYLQT